LEESKLFFLFSWNITNQDFNLCNIVVGVAQDVTESTTNNRAVASAARELRTLVNTANAPIFGVDVNGNINEWNDKTAEITGYTHDEALLMPLTTLLEFTVKDIMDMALIGVETSNFDIEFKNRDNETRHILVNATTRRDENSNIVGVLGVAQDVTKGTKHDR
jgi:PAS domain S-box-containing protein